MPPKIAAPTYEEYAYLIDMVENGRRVIRFTADVALNAFLDDEEKRDAVTYRTSIMGEAARFVSDDIRGQMPELPWPRIVGLRHKIAHEYNSIDPAVVWRVAREYVPETVRVVQAYLDRTPPPPSPADLPPLSDPNTTGGGAA